MNSFLTLLLIGMAIGIVIFIVGAGIYFMTDKWQNGAFFLAKIGVTIICVIMGWFAGYMAWEFACWAIREIAHLF